MMMPANYSAIAENEMSYVVGGGLVDVLAPVMTTENWKNVNTNLIKIVGNAYLDKTVQSALGMVFNGNYVPGGVLTGAFGIVKNIWGNAMNTTDNKVAGGAKGLFNIALQGVGILASIYTLGSGSIGIEAGKKFDLKVL